MASKQVLTSPSPPSSEAGTVLVETERLIIRRFKSSDAAAVAAAADFPSIGFNLRDRFPSPYTVADADAYMAMANSGPNPSYPEHCAIMLKPSASDTMLDEPLFIGGVGVQPKTDVYYRTWELGYWITPAHAGKGYATEAIGAFVRWIFQTWPRLNRMEAEIYARNTASGRVLRKCGFIEEGRRRGSVEKNGEVLDDVLFGVIRSDLEL